MSQGDFCCGLTHRTTCLMEAKQRDMVNQFHAQKAHALLYNLLFSIMSVGTKARYQRRLKLKIPSLKVRVQKDGPLLALLAESYELLLRLIDI